MKKILTWGCWIVASIMLGFIAFGCNGLSVFEHREYGDTIQIYIIEAIIRVIVYAIVVAGNIMLLVKLNNKDESKVIWKVLPFFLAILDLKWVMFGSVLMYRHVLDLLEYGDLFSYGLMIYYVIGAITVVLIPNMISGNHKFNKARK